MSKSLSEQVLAGIKSVNSKPVNNESKKVNETGNYTRNSKKEIMELEKDTTIEIGDEIVKIIGFYFLHGDFIAQYTVNGKKHEMDWKDFKQAILNSGYKFY